MSKRYFQQSCPVCGRLVRIDKHLKFETVVCQHCGGNFTATDKPITISRSDELPGRQGRRIGRLLMKSEQLLRSAKASDC